MVEYQVTVSNIQPDVLFVLCSILVVNSYALVQRIFLYCLHRLICWSVVHLS